MIIISFRGAQIRQFEADILKELEQQVGNQFSLVNEVEYNTKMGFSTENFISFCLNENA